MATSRPQMVTLMVPTTTRKTPKLAVSSLASGAQSLVEKKSPKETSPKKPIVGDSREITIAVVVATETTAQRASRPSITRSPQRGLAAARDRGGDPAPIDLAAATVSRASMAPHALSGP